MSKVSHLVVTWLVAFGTNFSALWILIANGWMQNPVGAVFNPDTMRMDLRAENRIRDGMVAYDALQKIRESQEHRRAHGVRPAGRTYAAGQALPVRHEQGHRGRHQEGGHRHRAEFWAFRVMVAVGMYLILFFGVAFWLALARPAGQPARPCSRWLWSLPLPWVARAAGSWPSTAASPSDRRRAADHYAASGLTITDLAISGIFLVLYTVRSHHRRQVMLHAIGGSEMTGLARWRGRRSCPRRRARLTGETGMMH